ncbi:DUF4381 domain-containing protein [Aureliella helgolandensis]|uniref:DUF4381 domain-containing protein n=1 Tax=Aureliella helgolandensis TaxID=2527968 RepID=A0A518G1M3_9BACT|nr:DUF4381 domain-containing protein [Aureliella helgolandensis]QDV22501.1 hypothetical protein Q31a_07870 [Aureliella helgolandensis]
MNDDLTSLDLLHDIVVPPTVSWWPLTPGWYVLLSVFAVGATYAFYRSWKQWHANAYRRVALQELASADSVAAISELLRRTALKVAPRAEVAYQTGYHWPDWMAARAAEPMSASCRQQLADGGYSSANNTSELGELKAYAARWIQFHRIPTGVDRARKEP